MSGADGDLAAVARRVSNWGRWGDDDELGTVNYVTPAARQRAAEAVREGSLHSLALPISSEYPQAPGSSRPNARHRLIGLGETFSDDAIEMALHGSTHWDALSHIFHEGRMYNGHLAAELVGENGAERNDITALSRRLLTRGVLLDVAAAKGVEWLPVSYEITTADLERCLEIQRVELHSGDALLIRTGQLGRVQRTDAWEEFTDCREQNPLEPGIGLDCLPWLHEREIAAVASDNWAVEVIASREYVDLPVHIAALVYMGMPLGEIFELDGLAAACAADGRYEFLLAAAPLPVEGGVGGPVHPVALR